MAAIIGFNFGKIEVKRTPSVKGKINIKNNVKIDNVETSDLYLGKAKEGGLRFAFTFETKYEPDAGLIKLEGDVLALEDTEKAESIVKEWKKNKKLDNEIMTLIINNILTRCYTQAIFLSREVGLPLPVPLPRLQPKKK